MTLSWPSRRWDTHGWRGRTAAAVGLCSGLCLALSVPPFGIWPLAVVGAAGLYLALFGQGVLVRLGVGELAGLGCFVPGLFWARAFNWYGAVVLMIVEAASLAIAAGCVPARRGRLPALVGACTLLEALRLSWPFGGLPLGGVFLGQAGGPLLDTARLGGPLLLTMEVWALGGALGLLAATAYRWYRGTWLGRPALVAIVVPVLVVVAVGVAAALGPGGGGAQGVLTVAAVQGGGKRGYSMRQVSPASVFRAQLDATEPLEAHGTDAPKLVVWPEDVIALNRPLGRSSEARIMANLARSLHTTVLAGVTITVSRTAFRNEVVAWGPTGRVVGVYEKVHRVPFGEYVPDRGFFAHLADLSGVPRDAIPGHSDGLLRTPAGRLGVMVSYEVFYAGQGGAAVRAGARVLVVPTNTSSYATSQVPTQEVAADQVQAVSTGRDLVQAAPTGYSTVVNDQGTVLQRSVLGRRQVLQATVARRSGMTLYDDAGGLPVLIVAAALLVAGWLWALRDRRSRWEPEW